MIEFDPSQIFKLELFNDQMEIYTNHLKRNAESDTKKEEKMCLNSTFIWWFGKLAQHFPLAFLSLDLMSCLFSIKHLEKCPSYPPGTQTQFLHYHSHHLHLLLTLWNDCIAFILFGDIEKLTRTVQKSMRIIGVEEKCVFRFPLRLATEEISIFCVSFSRSSQPVPNGPHIQHNFTSNWNVQRMKYERDR